MARDTSELRNKFDKLRPKEKAELARTLIDALDEDLDEDIEQLWLDLVVVAVSHHRWRPGDWMARCGR